MPPTSAGLGGPSTADDAARTGRALGTVRTQLRTVFGKTDTHRQAELVLYVLRIAALG